MATMRSPLKYVIFLIITTLFIGCTSIEKEYFIKPFYKSVMKNDQPITKGLGTIHINTIDFDKPDVDNLWIMTPIILLPGLSALPIASTTARNSSNKRVVLQEGEIEQILIWEMRNTGMFSEVGAGSFKGDYDIKGRINFAIDNYAHMSGFGIFYYFSIFPMLFFPMGTDHYTCEAHFDVIFLKDNKIVLSKDYRTETDKFIGFGSPYDYKLLQYEARSEVVGQEVFPAIIRDLVSDIRLNIQP